MKITSTTDISIGLYLSGIGHLGLITWALMGNPFLSRAPFNDLAITQVKIISEEQFQMVKMGRVEPIDDRKFEKLLIEKGDSTAPSKNQDRAKTEEKIEKNYKKSEALMNVKIDKDEQKKILVDRSAINSGVILDEKISSDSEVRGLSEKITESSVSGATKPENATVSREDLVLDNLPYKPFDISELLLKEVFKTDSIENALEDSKLIFKLQKIIEPAVEKCFNISNVELSVKAASVLVNFSLKENGKPKASSIELLSYNGGSMDDAEKLFGAARRAIIRCGVRGYNLPKDNYDSWKNVEAKFNSKGMQLK